MGYMIGVDVGGTFTDFSIFCQETGEIFHYKNSSTPDDPSKAIISGISQVLEQKNAEPMEVSYLAHGTTVSTNALIERKGAQLGLITTQGFKDLMEIGRQSRPSLYDLLAQKPLPLIPPGLNCEVPERVFYDGSIETPLDESETRDVVRFLKRNGVASIAVCTLFSFINPQHEQRIKEIIFEEFPEVYVTVSSELIPEFREFSRMSTTVLNAYLGPVMKQYLHNFQKSVADAGITVEPYITQSNGSIITIKETIECPIKTAVSGPSAGVIGAAYIGRQCGIDKIITFDMGGTSADISLIEHYLPQISNERNVVGYPARIPMINIVTIGAGGGSIAQIDDGGALKVGPESAGAAPGPACYGRGGQRPTVTDANIVLGKLSQKSILGGRMDVYPDKAVSAFEQHICGCSSLELNHAALGVLSVVNSNMVRAIRSVSVEKGYDAREFTLMAFGGAGPLHACEVAQDLDIPEVLIPPSPGTLCSLGLLMADTRFDISRTRIMAGRAENLEAINDLFDVMIKSGAKMLEREGVAVEDRSYERSIDMRYERQNFEISIPIQDAKLDEAGLRCAIKDFHTEHQRCYGYSNEKVSIQLINYRVCAVGCIEKPSLAKQPESDSIPEPIETRRVLFQGYDEYQATGIYRRDDFFPGTHLDGPAILEQMDATIVVPPRWTIKTDGFFNLKLTRKEVM